MSRADIGLLFIGAGLGILCWLIIWMLIHFLADDHK